MVFCAAAMIWSHVTGLDMSRPAFWATLLRYHSSWVLAQNGTVTSLPCHFEASRADCTRSASKSDSMEDGTGAR